MFRQLNGLEMCVAIASMVLAMGSSLCAAPPAGVKPSAAAKAPEHAHPDVGPHKGTLLELGEEEYHAEFLMDEKTETVTVYLLDGAVKNYVAIPAKDITIALKHDGKPESFKLKATPQKTDPAGLSSMFALKDEELVHDLHHKNNEARLMLKIDGKPFTAKIVHNHKHDHKH
jgi:hypothetical protein